MSNTPTAPQADDRASGAVFGLIIILGWGLFLFFTTQHAEGGPPASFAALVRGLADEGQQAVHAAISALSAVLLIGYAGFSARLGLARPAVLTGLIAFTIATAAIMIWTLLDGVVLPGMAKAYAANPDDFLDVLKPIFIFAGGLTRLLFEVRMIAVPIAIAAWSLALLNQTFVSRLVGLLGFGAAALLAAPLFAPQLMAHGGSQLMVFLAMAGIEALWGGFVAIQLLRGKI
jgi:hypothetical protein